MAFDLFLVPQYIDVETKIFGPITTRQFIIMLISGMIDFIFYKLFYFQAFVVLTLLNTAIFGVVAFLKINGMPFHYFFLNLVQTLKRPRLRVWKKEVWEALPPAEVKEVKKEFLKKPPLESSRLTALSLVVNTGGVYKEEQ